MSPQHTDPLSITTHYLRPGLQDAGCEIQTHLIRSGRTLSTARATLSQAGQARIEILAAMGNLEHEGPDEDSIIVEPPSMPPPAACIQRSAGEQGVELPLLNHIDVMLHPEQASAGRAAKAEASGWIRFKDQRPPDSLAAVFFMDAFPPSVFGLLGAVGWVPTIEPTVHIRRRPSPGWLLGQFKTSDLCNGRMIEDGALWDESGKLIAQSRQIGLLLKS